jgi:prepilin signal peptidase PulO-like enzyme (type II secretory pathway)
MSKNWIKPVAAVAIVVALFLGAGFRIGHPVSGLSTALGSAKSSLAVYKPSGQSTVGSKVVVEVKGLGTAIGVVKSASSGNVDVDLGATFNRVSEKDVSGKLIAVIPFLGSVFGIIGL